jgi:hypothetical protein
MPRVSLVGRFERLSENLNHKGEKTLERFDVGLIVRVNVLSDGTQTSNSGDANFSTLTVLKETFEEFEEGLEMFLKTLNDGFQNSIEYVNSNFAVGGLRRRCGFVKEWEELDPPADGDLNGCDSGNNTSSGMADKSTDEEIADQRQKWSG